MKCVPSTRPPLFEAGSQTRRKSVSFAMRESELGGADRWSDANTRALSAEPE